MSDILKGGKRGWGGGGEVQRGMVFCVRCSQSVTKAGDFKEVHKKKTKEGKKKHLLNWLGTDAPGERIVSG